MPNFIGIIFITFIYSISTFYIKYKLGPRVYPGGPKPYDSDKWLQCYNCGTIVPRVHAQQENEIAPIVDPPDTIHDSNTVVVLPMKSKSSRDRRAKIDWIKKTRPGANRRNMVLSGPYDLQRMTEYNNENTLTRGRVIQNKVLKEFLYKKRN